MLLLPSDIIKAGIRPGPRVAVMVGLEPCPPFARIVPGQKPAEHVTQIYGFDPLGLAHHSSGQYIAQNNLSCLDQKRSFGRSTAGLLSGISGLSGLCFLVARYSRLFLQQCSHQAMFGWAGCRLQLVHRPRSLACCALPRRLRLFLSLLTSGSMIR